MLVFVSFGGERISGKLQVWNLLFFLLGLCCDTIATGMMFNYLGGLSFDVHGISGLLAIILMLLHALWAMIVLIRKDEMWINKFHKFSLFVWFIWLVPYFSPMFFALAS